ncbi:hypothetical protein [Kribbella hippodromi]|uniref:hypothetical protein n=1 Tax=Kribbella hippodromi TaxID=434347 RepID=UPI0031E42F65
MTDDSRSEHDDVHGGESVGECGDVHVVSAAAGVVVERDADARWECGDERV